MVWMVSRFLTAIIASFSRSQADLAAVERAASSATGPHLPDAIKCNLLGKYQE